MTGRVSTCAGCGGTAIRLATGWVHFVEPEHWHAVDPDDGWVDTDPEDHPEEGDSRA